MEDKEPARNVVECDDNCGAFEEPETLEEYQDALEHWMNHECLAGCAHAR